MPTVTIDQINTAANNFILDTDTADSKINGAAGTVADRHGVVTKNLEQIFSEIGYLTPVAFASGLQVSSGNFVVEYNGDRYSARPSQVPFTTTSTFDQNQWLILNDELPFTLPEQFGASTGSTDNSAALQAMYASNPKAVYYKEFFPVTGNFPRLDIPHYGPGGWLISGVEVTANSFDIPVARDFYVNQATGSDTDNHGLTAAFPFRTIQRCIDPLRQGVPAKQQTINIAAGEHNQNYRPSTDFPRAGIVSVEGFGVGAPRTAQSGSDLVGNILLKGAGMDVTYIRSDPTSGFVRGPYFSSSHFAMQDLTIEGGAGGVTEAGLVIHRDTYGHCRRVKIDGAAGGTIKFGLISESDAYAEMIGCPISGCTINDVLNYAGMSLADPDGVGPVGNINAASDMNIAVGQEVTGDVTVAPGVRFSVAGILADPDVKRCKIGGNLSAQGATVSGAYLDLVGDADIEHSRLMVDVLRWNGTITGRGTSTVLRLNAGQSFIPPLTKSPVADPVELFDGAQMDPDASVNLLNSSAVRRGPRREVRLVSPASNGGVIPIPVGNPETLIKISATGGNRTGWTFAADPSGVYAGQKFGHGDKLIVIGGGFKTQILNGSTFKFVGGAIQISRNIPGSYSGFEATYDADGGYWCVTSLGILY